MLTKPELLAPAGNLEKVQVAFLYGADAVYLGTPIFGLRKYADNLNLDELEMACEIAQSHHKKLYLVLNGFAHTDDLVPIRSLLTHIAEFPIHALIISDLGVFHLAQQYTSIPIHVSTQANVTNKWHANIWKDKGARRIIAARELSIAECVEIKQYTGLEMEVFVHGSRCAGYSGQCILSNYTSARDANRGGCVQNCRHRFRIYDANRTQVGECALMNSKDLMGLSLIPELMTAGIDSFKIEGRMKSTLYIANTVRIYRKWIDAYWMHQEIDPDQLASDVTELTKISNRTFMTGFATDRTWVNQAETGCTSAVLYIGIIKALYDQFVIVDVRNPFKVGDVLEYLHPDGSVRICQVNCLLNTQWQSIDSARINQIVFVEGVLDGVPFGILRRNI